jgi:hypothetical protein
MNATQQTHLSDGLNLGDWQQSDILWGLLQYYVYIALRSGLSFSRISNAVKIIITISCASDINYKDIEHDYKRLN